MRRPAAVALVAGAVISSIILAGCGQQAGLALARQACGHVDRSLALFGRAEHAPTPAQASRERDQAYEELRNALQYAAQANSDDGRWDALMTTISESARVDEGLLTTALRAQCQVAESSQQDQAPFPNRLPPPPNGSSLGPTVRAHQHGSPAPQLGGHSAPNAAV